MFIAIKTIFVKEFVIKFLCICLRTIDEFFPFFYKLMAFVTRHFTTMNKICDVHFHFTLRGVFADLSACVSNALSRSCRQINLTPLSEHSPRPCYFKVGVGVADNIR